MSWSWVLSGVVALLAVIALIPLVSGEEGLFHRMRYGKPVFTDTSAEARAKAEEALKAAGIPYICNTVKSRPGVLQRTDAAATIQFNSTVPVNRYTGDVGYVYQIFVQKARREEALRALSA